MRSFLGWIGLLLLASVIASPALALPAIVAGLRVATVSTIALATIAAFVIPEGLGRPIFIALRDYFKTEIIAAGALAILLALVVDAFFVLGQRALTPWAYAKRSAA